MRIYVIRHAAAAPRDQYDRDEDRPLTEKGVARMEMVSAALKAMKAAPARIFSSPLIRAEHTARIVRKALGVKSAVEQAQVLAPGHSAAEVLEFLAAEVSGDAAIVGHEPQLGEVVSLMVAGLDEPVVDMKKSAVCCVEFDASVEASAGVIAWHLVPQIVESLFQK